MITITPEPAEHRDARYARRYRLNAEHRFSIDTDRCVCGGLVVYFEDGDADGRVGEGCEVANRVWARRCTICGERLSGEIAEMYDPVIVGMYGDQMTPAQEAQYSGVVHAECGLSKGWEVA
jgi:hypothetical protein